MSRLHRLTYPGLHTNAQGALLDTRDGTPNLETLREAPVCVVLADHMLRGTTGVEVAAKMKKIRPDVPLILYSGTNPDSMKNVDLFINKDVPTSMFLAILRDVLSRYCS